MNVEPYLTAKPPALTWINTILKRGCRSKPTVNKLLIISDLSIKHINRFSQTKFFERKIVIIFLPISFSISFGRSKEPSH